MRLDRPDGFRHTPNALSRLRSVERAFVFLRRLFSEIFPQTATSVRNSTSRFRRATSSCARYSRCSSTRPTSGSVRCSKTTPARSRSRRSKSGWGRHVTQTARCSGFAGSLAAHVVHGGLFTALLRGTSPATPARRRTRRTRRVPQYFRRPLHPDPASPTGFPSPTRARG